MSEPTWNLDATEKPLCFVARKSDGKFLRGARFWRWTKHWRHAALLSPIFVEGFVVGTNGITSMNDLDFYTVNLAEQKP